MKTKLSLLITLSLALPLQAISVKQLLQQDAIPATTFSPVGRTLDLSHLNIDSLEGLQEIPGIETVSILKLGNNKLTTIPSNSFQGLTKLRALGLMNNQIKTIDSHAFADSGLKIIILNGNQLRDIEKDTFTDLSPWLIAVGDNPLPKWAIKKIRKQAPLPAVILTVAPTKKNLAAVGAGVVVIGLTVAAITVGPGIYREHEARELTKQAFKTADEQSEKQLTEQAVALVGWERVEEVQDQLSAEALTLLKKADATMAQATKECLQRRGRPGDCDKLTANAKALRRKAEELVGRDEVTSLANFYSIDLERLSD